MVEVKIENNEWYPISCIVEDYEDYSIELSEEELDRIEKAFKEFKLCQYIIKSKNKIKSRI